MDNFLDLYNQFVELVKEGDEEKIRSFLVNNIDRFPDNLKRDIVSILFEEAVDRIYDDFKNQIDYFTQILKIKNSLENIKRTLEDKKKGIEIQKRIMEEF